MKEWFKKLNITKDNYQDLTTLIIQQHRDHNFKTPHTHMLALLNKYAEGYYGINDWLRHHTYEETLELLENL